MANIIIPPEHQSAPKTHKTYAVGRHVILPTKQMPTRESEQPYYHREGFDSEMDLATYDDPVIAAQMKELRRLEKSPQQTLESAQRKFEENKVAARQQQWKGQDRWRGRENEEMRVVNVLSPEQFIAKLRRAGVNAADENPCVNEYIRIRKAYHPDEDLDEIVGDGGPRIWLNDFIAQIKMKKPSGEIVKVSTGRLGVNAWVKPQPGSKAWEQNLFVMRTVTTLQYPLGPEWTVMNFDAYDVPTTEKYHGWRTALLQLIVAGALTEQEANRAFGEPRTEASEFYRQQLYQWRNRVEIA